MQTALGHLTFCSNIFPGESWEDHFKSLREYVPAIKNEVAPQQPFGIGLRLAHQASVALHEPGTLEAFRSWLSENDCYVFTMNGFPYGNFHHTRVKDQVHAPDWTTIERTQYTLRLTRILAGLLPEGHEGSVSTSPLSYKPWFNSDPHKLATVTEEATRNIIAVISELYQLHRSGGKMIHLNIEPEADGLLESWQEFRDWFNNHLLVQGAASLRKRFSIPVSQAEDIIRDHLRLCYDVCHFAVGFENMDHVLRELTASGIRIGKWQLSAALKVRFSGKEHEDERRLSQIGNFDEPVYLHQVVSKTTGDLNRFTDLPEALKTAMPGVGQEWRSHFHVPLFLTSYGLLQSTQGEVIDALRFQAAHHYANHLEVETYTWDVLPDDLRLPVAQSVSRELKWVLDQIEQNQKTKQHA